MRADRLLSIVMLLQSRGKMTAATLADELDVSRRTILRDVDALSFAGVPIYAEGGHGGGFALDENYRTPLTGLKEEEVRALFIFNNTSLLGDIGLGDAAESTLRKLFASLPASHQPSVDYIRQRIHIDPLWWWHDTQPLPFLETLQQAVYEDCCIQGTYEHYNGNIVERVLEPYSLVAKSSLWYLVARHDGELRTYRVSRFHEVTLLGTPFRRPDDFDLPTYWQAHLQEFTTTIVEYAFTLRIHESKMKFIGMLMPGRWHIVEPPDGDGWLTAQFHLESLDLAKMLIFGLGNQAVVIEPQALRDAVVEAAREIVEQPNEAIS